MLISKVRYKKNKAAFAQTLIRRLKKMDKIKMKKKWNGKTYEILPRT